MDDSGITHAAAYVADGNGKVSFILKSGMTSRLGTITRIGSQDSFGIGLNGRGQVALTAQIDHGPDTVLLLTPKAP